MRIYHTHCSMCSNISSSPSGLRDFKNAGSRYKSKDKLKLCTYSCKTIGGVKSKKPKSLRKKKISKKNVKFLEGLGLKVKQKD